CRGIDDAQAGWSAPAGRGRTRGGRRTRRGDGVDRRRRGRAHLEHDDADDAEQEQVEERQEAELEDGENGLRHYDASNRIAVAPTEISSPSRRRCSCTGTPFTRVPFIDPRSTTTKPSSRGRISA